MNRELANALAQLRLAAGNPSTRQIAKGGDGPTHQTVARILNGEPCGITSLRFVVERLGGDIENFLPFVPNANERAPRKRPERRSDDSEPVNHRLADALVNLRFEAGNPNLRDIAGKGLSPKTVADALNGKVRTVVALRQVVERLGGKIEDFLDLAPGLPPGWERVRPGGEIADPSNARRSRAGRFYTQLKQIQENGGQVFVRRSPDGELEPVNVP